MSNTTSTNHQPGRSSRGWSATEMVGKRKLEHLLVVVDDVTLGAEDPSRTPLCTRAAMVAGAVGCRVTFHAPCAEETLAQGFLQSDESIRRRQQELVDNAATRLAELENWLETTTGIPAASRAVWEPLEEAAILAWVHDIQPDLVMKTSSEASFFLGLLTNVDWELMRRSPAPVWFVGGSGDKSSLASVLTALGTGKEADEVIAARDYDVCALANLIAASTGATHTILHTYQIPQGIAPYAAYAPEIAALPPEFKVSNRDQERQVAAKHGEAIRAFAQFFQIDTEQILLRPGRLSDVTPEVAEQIHAELIVMGTRSLTRLQRLLQPVSAEPVLSQAPCDVLVVAERKKEEEAGDKRPRTVHSAMEGEPRLDLEEAVVNPEKVFGTPLALAQHPALSLALRLRLLKIWESDVRAEMVEEEEGGVIQATRADRLQDIHQARELLKKDAPHLEEAVTQPEYS